MKVQYKIYELDEGHLDKSNYVFDNRDRIRLVGANLGEWLPSTYDTFEEAVEAIKNCGKNFIEYTIIPRIYKRNHYDNERV